MRDVPARRIRIGGTRGPVAAFPYIEGFSPPLP